MVIGPGADGGDLDRSVIAASRLAHRRLELLLGTTGADDAHGSGQAVESRRSVDGRVRETDLVSERRPHGGKGVGEGENDELVHGRGRWDRPRPRRAGLTSGRRGEA